MQFCSSDSICCCFPRPGLIRIHPPLQPQSPQAKLSVWFLKLSVPLMFTGAGSDARNGRVKAAYNSGHQSFRLPSPSPFLSLGGLQPAPVQKGPICNHCGEHVFEFPDFHVPSVIVFPSGSWPTLSLDWRRGEDKPALTVCSKVSKTKGNHQSFPAPPLTRSRVLQ